MQIIEIIIEKIGAAGFEPATTGTPYRCATRLRHAPIPFQYTETAFRCPEFMASEV